MNIIQPKMVNLKERQRIKSLTNQHSPSFKGVPTAGIKHLMSEADDHVIKVFSKYYGDVGTRLVNKVDKLVKTEKALNSSSRFIKDQAGNIAIKDKSIPKSLLENIVFPFITLPRYAMSFVLKPFKDNEFIEKIYKSPFLRNPRKINEINGKTNQIKGILEKTRSTVSDFIKEKGLKDSADDIIRRINEGEDSDLIREANEYLQEKLYKASNKFFDKHTGNFNTAHERPLNRIVTGLIPVAFLANDAYNLSVLCGDKKEDSTKEARERTKQEISRVLTTAYIQLLTFGAFTKQVNTLSWFTPLTSAATVLFSETSSRMRLGKPIFFLSKEKAKEYNKKDKEKQNQTPTAQTSIKPANKSHTTNLLPVNQNNSQIFASFKASKPENKKSEKPKEQKALINFDTFKKGVGILIAGGFAVSFLKNSSFTKNSQFMQFFKDMGKFVKEKVYNPLAFKNFEIKTEDFEKMMGILDDVGCKEIADGHRFIKGKYADLTQNAGSILMKKSSISSSGTKKVIETITETIKDISEKELDDVKKAIKLAIGQNSDAISEMNYEKVAKKAIEIIKNKKVNLKDEQLAGLTIKIAEEIKSNSTDALIQMERKSKPFIDILTEPFKFILSAANLPFKLTKTVINLLTSPVQKKAAQAALGKEELTKIESAINRAVVEVFGEKKSKSGKISQTIFANAMEQLQKRTEPYTKAKTALENIRKSGASEEEIKLAEQALEQAKLKLKIYVDSAVSKSFDGVTQSSNKNTDLAMMTKLASSTVTSAFLVADNYNMVMIKSDGEDTEGAKEKANERIIQRLSALFYQTMLINWFNSTFRSTYNSSLLGMTSVAIPNTLTTEVLTRKSIGMPIGRKSYKQLVENEEKNENQKGLLGKYFKFMRLLTGKKPLKDRMPRDKQIEQKQTSLLQTLTANNTKTTNVLELLKK